jgi:hypothetical protein
MSLESVAGAHRIVHPLDNMTVAHDMAHRTPTHQANTMALEDRFEVLKEIGDGSFGSVVLARVRTAGASVARRGTVVSSNVGVCPGQMAGG